MWIYRERPTQARRTAADNRSEPRWFLHGIYA
jgi:hypothetical protein